MTRTPDEIGELVVGHRFQRVDQVFFRHSKRLKSAATLVDTAVTDMTQALKQRPAKAGSATGGPAALDPLPATTPELQAIEAELARKHWDAWVDTKVPALGNKTRRQAAKSARGRERLEALLADYDLGLAMMRQNLRRQFATDSDAQIEQRLLDWRLKRADAPDGDAEGRLVRFPRTRS